MPSCEYVVRLNNAKPLRLVLIDHRVPTPHGVRPKNPGMDHPDGQDPTSVGQRITFTERLQPVYLSTDERTTIVPGGCQKIVEVGRQKMSFAHRVKPTATGSNCRAGCFVMMC